MPRSEKLFEGIYQYFHKGQNYSQENFYVELVEESRDLIFNAEILSRVETGEFFKMQISYALNQFYVPQRMSIEKFLGDKESRELFEIDPNSQTLLYTFQSGSEKKSAERPFSTTKHILSAPCFVTAGLFTQLKKVDPTARTPLFYVTPQSAWEFKGPPEDKIMWVDVKNHDTEELQLDGIPLTASKYELHDEDALSGNLTHGAQVWISKHYSIPYQLQENDGSKIIVRRLKKLKQDMEKIF